MNKPFQAGQVGQPQLDRRITTARDRQRVDHPGTQRRLPLRCEVVHFACRPPSRLYHARLDQAQAQHQPQDKDQPIEGQLLLLEGPGGLVLVENAGSPVSPSVTVPQIPRPDMRAW